MQIFNPTFGVCVEPHEGAPETNRWVSAVGFTAAIMARYAIMAFSPGRVYAHLAINVVLTSIRFADNDIKASVPFALMKF